MPLKHMFKSLVKLILFPLKLSELQSLWKDKALTDGVFQTMHHFDSFPNMQISLKFSILDFVTHKKTWKCNYPLLINNCPPTLALSSPILAA